MTNTRVLIIVLAVMVPLAFGLLYLPRLTKSPHMSNTNSIRYLPLGDSYTIGESVSEQDRWPNQLTARYKTKAHPLEIIANPAVTGYTTQDLIDRELPLLPKLKPDFVTIQIGVNDYVQGVSADQFSANLNTIIQAVQSKLADPRNILLVTIPDYGKTPTGAQFGSSQSSEAGVTAFNAIIAQAGNTYKLPVADVFPVSQKVATDPSLIAADGLHPSATQYADWTEVIAQALQAAGLPR